MEGVLPQDSLMSLREFLGVGESIKVPFLDLPFLFLVLDELYDFLFLD